VHEHDEDDRDALPATIRALFQRLYRDPRYLLVDRVERLGRERIAFVEVCTVLSPTGDVRGQALLSREYSRTGRPDGERPYGEDSLLDHHLRDRGGEAIELSEDDLSALRDETWQYYVRRNFCFLMEDYHQAREDAEHNLGVSNLVQRSNTEDAAKWSFVRWWPWVERDRAIAQAMWDLEHNGPEQAANELYRAQRGIEQFGHQHAEQYAEEEGENQDLGSHMVQHIGALVELLRRDRDLPVSLDEQFDQASARGDSAETDRLRAEMIRRAVDVDGEEDGP
jgi:hypothetical protein